MEDDDLIDGLPVLKKKSTPDSNSIDGLPVLKKKTSPNVAPSGVNLSPTGSELIPNSQESISPSPVLPQYQQQVQDRQAQDVAQQHAEDLQHEQDAVKSLKDGTFATALKNQSAKQQRQIIDQQVNQNNEQVQQQHAQEAEEDRNAYKGSIPLSDRVSAATNNIYNGLGTMGKGLVRSAGTIAKAITPDAIVAPERYNNAVNKLLGAVDKGIDFAKKNTTERNGQIDPKELEAINKNPINGLVNGLAEFAPAIASAERTGGMSFFMNDYEKGYENIDKASNDNGLNLSEGAKQAYGIAQGTASALLMTHNLHSLLGNAGEKTTQSVIDKVSLDAIDNLKKSGADLTADNLKKATMVSLDNIEDRVKNYGLKSLKGTATSIGDISALEAAKIGADHLANTATGKQVFNMDNQADRMHEAIKNGALFGIVGALARSPLLLSKGTPERNNVIENLYNDPSQEKVDQIKNTVQQHLGDKGISQDDIDATKQTVDQIHEVAKSLPKNLPFEKQAKITDLILERKNLEKTQSDNALQNKQLDPVFAEQHENHDLAYQDRVDSINDRIKSIASGTPVKYFKDEEGQPMKQFGDEEPEKISENRYYTEKPHLALTPEETPKTTENESTNEKNGEESSSQSSEESSTESDGEKVANGNDEKGLLKESGEAKVESDLPVAKVEDKELARASEISKIPEVKANVDFWSKRTPALAKTYLEDPLEYHKNINDEYDKRLANETDPNLIKNNIIGKENNQKIIDKIEAINEKYKDNIKPEVATPTKEAINLNAEVVPTDVENQTNPLDNATPTTETPTSNSGESTSVTKPVQSAEAESEKTEKTGVANADVANERGEVIPRTAKTREQIEAEGKRLVDKDEDFDPDDLARSIIDNPRPVKAEEQSALRYYKTKLKNRQRAILKDTSPENATENQIEYAKNEDLLENNRKATEIIGNETARTLGDREGGLNDDYTRTAILDRAKLANNGEAIPAPDREVLETHAKKIESLESQLADREEEIRKLNDQALIDRTRRRAELEERQNKRTVTKSSLRKEREELQADLRIIARKSMGELGANKIPVEMLAPLSKLARNYVLDGIVTLSGVVDKVYNDLKDHIDGLDRSDVENVVKDNFDAYLKEQNQIRLNRSKKAQGKKLDALKEQLATGDYEKRIQRKIEVDNDYLKIRAEINRQQLLINKKIAEIADSQKSTSRRAVDFAVKWARNVKLASITVLGKLAATGVTTMGLKGVTEGVGAGISKLLPNIAKKSTIEGGASVRALAQSYAKAATLGMEDSWKELNIKKGGQSDLSALYGKYSVGRLPAEAADFFGHLHSAIKAPIKRQAWEYSYAKRIAKGIENGIDVQDPIIDAKNRLDAYKDAERAIFMGDNVISKAYEASMKTLENSSSSAQNIAALTRILLPFVKVPTNIALSTGRYAFGSVLGLGKLAQIAASSGAKAAGAEGLAILLHKGMGELTPEESDMVLRNLKHGSVGAAALLIGFYNPKNVGGFYQENEHRKPNDANVGSFRVGGHKIPIWLTEHPIFQAMQIGSTFRRVLDAHKHKEDKVSAATLATVSGLAEGIPLANEAKQITDLFGSDTKKGYKFLSSMVKGAVEPAALQQIATVTDTKNGDAFTFNGDNQQKRQPDKKHGFLKYMRQDLATGIPGLRKTVPKKH